MEWLCAGIPEKQGQEEVIKREAQKNAKKSNCLDEIEKLKINREERRKRMEDVKTRREEREKKNAALGHKVDIEF